MHPKNSNKPPVVQEALLTCAMPIHLLDVNDSDSGLIQVCAGKPVDEANFLASILLTSAADIMARLTDGGMGANEIFGVRFLVESSAALIDASARSVEPGCSQGGAQ